ncbi:MAG TPA: FAD-dependent oxidoreductase [Nocardioides sp.]|uniref:NAD(P)/FAD-dependent oxidoreductase n=1 Tax=Nocardioides sp. TaxID=35761 RepID=UPI002E334D1C|nr:FAD-dependent oxidoreductase [Nocardioides sp.]HEX3930505.1 FAD-dependent oxidoreductase [Nocardioides sp.]
MASRLVVVGGGLAGLRAAETLRAAGWAGEIRIVGAEAHLPYDRPPLSKTFSTTEPSYSTVALRGRASIADVRWDLGVHVRRADLAGRTLETSTGSRLGFDGLVVATGLTPRRLSVTAGRSDCHVLRSLDDAVRIHRSLTPRCRVVIVGAGFVGCEVAAALRDAGHVVDVVDVESEPMRRAVGPTVGRAIRRRHEQRGVAFHRRARVVAVEGPSGRPLVRLDSGAELRAAVVIEAIGSTANTEWLSGNGLDLTDGVLATSSLAVTDGVVAAGDVARFPNSVFDDVPRRYEHWQMAAMSAKHAGRTLVDQLSGRTPAEFAAVPWFWSVQGDVRLQAYGLPSLGAAADVVDGRLEEDVAVRFTRDGRVVGMVLIGFSHLGPTCRDLVGMAA